MLLSSGCDVCGSGCSFGKTTESLSMVPNGSRMRVSSPNSSNSSDEFILVLTGLRMSFSNSTTDCSAESSLVSDGSRMSSPNSATDCSAESSLVPNPGESVLGFVF